MWCMAGHMLGLGDRHGENILIDATSGDTVHVDFGCLFDRGLMLEVGDDVITSFKSHWLSWPHCLANCISTNYAVCQGSSSGV